MKLLSLTCSRSHDMDRLRLNVFELEDEIPDGWYLHRFGVGERMAICLQPVSYIGYSICNSRRVSNNHASIELLADGSWFIKDLKSEHGTFVNDKIIPEEGLVLEEWDVICLGRKRPLNAKEFGFMLKYKETSSSEKSCSIKTKSSSYRAPSTIKASTSENETNSFHLQDTPQCVSKESNPTSPILISDGSCDGDKSGNDSERTVKLTSFSSVKLSQDNLNQAVDTDILILQQQTASVKEKIDDWLLKNESSSGTTSSSRHKTRRIRKSIKRNYLDTDDNLSDSDTSSKTTRKGYKTRTRDNTYFSWTSNHFSESEVSCSDESDSELSKHKRQKHDRYYEDHAWNPYTDVKSPKKLRKRFN